jgi:hypothetical protein
LNFPNKNLTKRPLNNPLIKLYKKQKISFSPIPKLALKPSNKKCCQQKSSLKILKIPQRAMCFLPKIIPQYKMPASTTDSQPLPEFYKQNYAYNANRGQYKGEQLF